ncbi:hypothetical protein L486_00699 [Kwoniella mangroviensis CBS 10435]|uniref:Short-chain dehydrogenase n=1 Tax=Kwoniella mangroviensis CBS 10435 TaxID=1331196 RepID=A0A1B9IZT9_9TREE|nr:hypothetical protein L486_00699 [Kwoniella mangroviensis CBS 10435]
MSGPEPTPLSILTTPKLFFLAGKTIIISGGGRGLGLSVARRVLEAGANVAAVDLLPVPTEPEWSEYQQIARANELTLSSYNLDISDAKAVEQLFEKVFEDASPSAPVHDMFLAAGVPPSLTVLDSSIEYWRKVFDVNTAGSFLCCKAFADEWLSRNKTNGNPGVGGASIVLTASVAGHVANRQIPCSAYSASKAAVIHMAKSFAAEWGKLGIRVNAVSPGYIKTVMTAGIVAARPGYEEDMVNSTLLGRASTGDEYRGPAVFLLSEASSFVIGADIVVDGGHAA